MASSGPIPWWHSIRTRILLPSIVLFGIFTAMVIVGSARVYTESIETRVSEGLHKNTLLMDALLREEEKRIALHARFTADMVRLSEQFSGASRGRSTLIYLLEFLKQAGVEIHMYSGEASADDPYAGLVRKGMLGVRTTALGVEATEMGAVLSIASVAPIERMSGIREVTVSTYHLDETRLGELKSNLGVDITLSRGDRVIASTLPRGGCRQALGELLTEDLRGRVLLQDESPIRDFRCGEETMKSIFHPMKINFRDEAIYALSVSLEDLLLAKRAIRTRITLTAVLVLVTAVLIYSLLVRKITQPLSNLARLTRRVAASDFGARAEIATRDEVGELGRSYNSMIERLEQRQRELDELHQRELDQAHRLASIGELAGSLAHEIRNPLGGISGAMEILRDDDRMDSSRREILEEVLNQIKRLEKLTKDLLDYAKPVVPRLRQSDVNELVDRAIFLVELGEKDLQIRLEKHYDPGLPKVDLDPEQIQQVFLNILLNAVQAVDNGGNIRVTTSHRRESERESVFVEFKDNGVGMTPENLKKALRPFFTTKAKGTGLGLSIAREIMRSHGGSLEVQSHVGRGTCVTLRLPLADSGIRPAAKGQDSKAIRPIGSSSRSRLRTARDVSPSGAWMRSSPARLMCRFHRWSR